jgi:hypothetical protein
MLPKNLAQNGSPMAKNGYHLAIIFVRPMAEAARSVRNPTEVALMVSSWLQIVGEHKGASASFTGQDRLGRIDRPLAITKQHHTFPNFTEAHRKVSLLFWEGIADRIAKISNLASSSHTRAQCNS